MWQLQRRIHPFQCTYFTFHLRGVALLQTPSDQFWAVFTLFLRGMWPYLPWKHWTQWECWSFGCFVSFCFFPLCCQCLEIQPGWLQSPNSYHENRSANHLQKLAQSSWHLFSLILHAEPCSQNTFHSSEMSFLSIKHVLVLLHVQSVWTEVSPVRLCCVRCPSWSSSQATDTVRVSSLS